MLRPLVLAFDNDAGREMRQANCRISLVDVLTACARRTIGINAKITGIDFSRFYLIRFGKNSDSTGRRMNSSLRFRCWHALYAVGT